MRSAKGEFWQQITDALRWRKRRRCFTPAERQSFSINGRCPWIGGTKRVRPWNALTDKREPSRAELADNLREGETVGYVESIAQRGEEVVE